MTKEQELEAMLKELKGSYEKLEKTLAIMEGLNQLTKEKMVEHARLLDDFRGLMRAHWPEWEPKKPERVH